MTNVSPQWQQVLFLAAALLLLWQGWRGWKLGAVRGLLRLTALFCAWIAGSAAAGASGTALAFFSKIPPLLAPAVFGVVVGVLVYLAISFFAGLLFKRTDDHVGVIRVGFGLGGAFFGLLYGLLLLWGGITMIRGLGALGEMRIVQAGLQGRSAESEAAAAFLLKLKNSLEQGSAGEMLKGADPLPASFYDNIVKVSRVSGNTQTLKKFLTFPAAQEVLKNPKVQALLKDSAFVQAAKNGKLLDLLQQKGVLSLLQDPQLKSQLKGFDLAAALDFALKPDANQTQVKHVKNSPPVAPTSPPPANQGITPHFPALNRIIKASQENANPTTP